MQFRMTPNKLMIGLFAVILLAVPITTAVLPKQERSENENRTLAEFPQLVNSKKLEKAENFGGKKCEGAYAKIEWLNHVKTNQARRIITRWLHEKYECGA